MAGICWKPKKHVRKLAVLFLGTVTASTADIQILENTPVRLRFEFTLDSLSIKESDRYSYVHVNGFDPGIPSPSGHLISGMPIYVGVPEEGSARISYSVTSTRTVRLKKPLPKPDSPSTHLPESGNAKWISTPSYSHFGAVRTVQFMIRFCRLSQDQTNIIVPERAECTIEFPATPVAAIHTRPGPLSSYEELVKSLLLNYEMSRRWVRSHSPGLLRRREHTGSHPLSAGDAVWFEIGDGHDGFRECTFDEDGLIRIDGAQVKKALGRTPRIDNLRVFASPRFPLDREVPAVDAIPFGLTEVPIIFRDTDGDRKLDDKDWLYCYVTGVSGRHYDRSRDTYAFRIHAYAQRRRYWIVESPDTAMSIPNYSCTASSQRTLTSVPDKAYYRKALYPGVSNPGGTEWAWKNLIPPNNFFRHSFRLRDRVASTPCSIAFDYGHRRGSVSVSVSGKNLCTGCSIVSAQTFLPDEDSDELEFEIRSTDSLAFRGFEVTYTRVLDMHAEADMRFPGIGGTDIVTYSVTNLPNATCYAFRLTGSAPEISLIDTIPPEHSTFSFNDTAGMGAQYHIVSIEDARNNITLNHFTRRADIGSIISNPRKAGHSADLLIVTDESLQTQATRLAEHKEEMGRFSRVRIVQMQDIYRWFSGGTVDPTALRNMLLYASTHWRISPEYVILFGNAHYDYKQYITSKPIQVPSSHFGEDCMDDYFAVLSPGENIQNHDAPDLILGRIPAESPTDAAAVVDKIIAFEGEHANLGEWRSRMLLVADDDMQGPKADRITDHHLSSERLANAAKSTMPSLELRKVYLFEYPWDTFYEKPAAEQALVREINMGVGFVNFFGHGTMDLWADEHIFTLNSLSSLQPTYSRFPLVTSFSCSVGKFDDPEGESLSGALVRARNRGAIAAIGATRTTTPGANTRLAITFYDSILHAQCSRPIGWSLLQTKLKHATRNSFLYVLLGDPTLKFAPSADSISLTILDGDGKIVNEPKALQEITIKGRILSEGAPDNTFGSNDDSAWISLSMFGPDADSVRRKDGGKIARTYSLPGPTLYQSGKVRVLHGRFSARMIVPRSVPSDSAGSRLTAHAWSSERTAFGSISNIRFNGSMPIPKSDTSGPTVSFVPLYGETESPWNSPTGFRDTLAGPPGMRIKVVLKDRTGLDLLANAPGEGLCYRLHRHTTWIQVPNSDVMLTNADNNYKGEFIITPSKHKTETGVYTLEVSAQDIIGNVSKTALTLKLSDLDDPEVHVWRVFNYPNPVRLGEATRFFFYVDKAEGFSSPWVESPVATVKLYTLSGKPIRILENIPNGHRFLCEDQFGNRLSPNVYLYTVEVRVPTSEGAQVTSQSKFRKLVVHPPR